MRYTSTPEPELATGLGTGRNDEVFRAVKGLEGDVDAERGLGHGHMQHVDEVVTDPVEPLGRPHSQVDVEITGRPASGPG